MKLMTINNNKSMIMITIIITTEATLSNTNSQNLLRLLYALYFPRLLAPEYFSIHNSRLQILP